MLQQVKVGLSELKHIADYSEQEVRTSHDGLNVVTLVHSGQGHEAAWPLDCRECGRRIAEQLHLLGVGDTGKYTVQSFALVLSWLHALTLPMRSFGGSKTSLYPTPL